MPPLHTPPTHLHQARGRVRARRSAIAAALAAVALVAGGCGGSGSSSPASGSSPSATFGGNPPMATTVTLGHVVGDRKKPYHHRFTSHEKSLRKHVGHAVDSWFDGGFVGVSYPRSDFATAFHGFTSQAKHDARAQQKLMTNWKWRQRIDGVATTKREVSLDVLAPHGRPAGVTAHVILKFTTSGHAAKKVTVTGRLFLTKDAKGTWRIFGFDISKGAK